MFCTICPYMLSKGEVMIGCDNLYNNLFETYITLYVIDFSPFLNNPFINNDEFKSLMFELTIVLNNKNCFSMLVVLYMYIKFGITLLPYY